MFDGFEGVDFVAVDVETAASSRSSICQIGLIGWGGGRERFAHVMLVNPRCAFDGGNIGIHGIRPEDVADAPAFGSVYETLRPALEVAPLVAHSDFDRQAFDQACGACAAPPPGAPWIDTVKVARATWPGLPNYKLPTVAAQLAHSFDHHDALADARAAAIILDRAMATTGRGVAEWVEHCRPQGRGGAWAGVKRQVRAPSSTTGVMAGESVVLTGDFSAPKAEWADAIAAAGGAVASSVSRKTTILVNGYRDAAIYGDTPSANLARALALNEAGAKIIILDEDQLRRWLA